MKIVEPSENVHGPAISPPSLRRPGTRQVASQNCRIRYAHKSRVATKSFINSIRILNHTKLAVFTGYRTSAVAAAQRGCDSFWQAAHNCFISRILSATKRPNSLLRRVSPSRPFAKALRLRRSTVLYDSQRELDLRNAAELSPKAS